MKRRQQKQINLALQGGGSHGAFTWGVLDRLLEDEHLEIEGISGASAGAMNAVMLAYGLTIGGRDGARQVLADFWESAANQMPFISQEAGFSEAAGALQNGGSSPMWNMLLPLTRFFSPYELNPFDVNPLRDMVTARIDFERLRTECEIKLFIAATQVRTGKLRLFRTRELTADMLLASACLPSVHQAIEVDDEAYWDGGYSANPAIYPLLYRCQSPEVVVVLLHPLARPESPKTAQEIWNRVTELSFTATFLREMRAIIYAKDQAEKAFLPLSRLEKRLRNLHFHIIEAEELMAQLSPTSKLNTDRAFLSFLHEQGRSRADAWLTQHRDNLGVRSSINLNELFC